VNLSADLPKLPGRPRVFTDDELQLAASLLPDPPSSRRGRQDAAYAVRAVLILQAALGEPSLPTTDRRLLGMYGEPTAPATWQRTLLAALGRIDDPRELVGVALVLAERRPQRSRVRDGAALVRRIRRELRARS
jgi:hypothetical protein